MAQNSVDSYAHVDEVDAALRAAEKIVPVVLQFTGAVNSVADVGGGTGAWLSQFHKAGVQALRLFDSRAVERHLLVPRSCFTAVDLERELPPKERFDLVVCVECAEHLRPERAQPLVDWLTSAANIVVFSAAIPGQGGKAHIHEQYPRYWADRFSQRGFVQRDVIRQHILFDNSIVWWYRQNLFLYVKEGWQLGRAATDFLPKEFTLIHQHVENAYERPRLAHVLSQLGPACMASFSARMGWRNKHKE